VFLALGYTLSDIHTCGISPDANPTGRITPPHAILDKQKRQNSKENYLTTQWIFPRGGEGRGYSLK